MTERTLPNVNETAETFGTTDPKDLDDEGRRDLVASMASAILCGQASGDDPGILQTLDALVCDPDWAVRLEVARMMHLLDAEACKRYAGTFRHDCNSYVRKNAERGLVRKRKAGKAARKKKTSTQSYRDQVDRLERQYGQRVAKKVVALADQRYGMLAASHAHDVRSILATLSSNAAVLLGKTSEPKRMASMIDDIRYLERAILAIEHYTTPLPVQRRPEDLAEMIRESIDKARRSVADQGYDVTALKITMAAQTGLRLRVSRRLIVMALTNVIKNAMEAFAPVKGDALSAGQIDVQAVVDGYETRVLVRDDGLGIESEVVDELLAFVPGSKNKAKRNSSGWGLCLTHRYITAHDGTLAIDSEVDKGTTVIITIPMQAPMDGEEE
ncbi:MAG: HAMP domain-containing histidine kinase [Phycisphaerae bacterium]|nr:HAMP domain-containing histidine kinase [Phycisphaerae bacterium]